MEADGDGRGGTKDLHLQPWIVFRFTLINLLSKTWNPFKCGAWTEMAGADLVCERNPADRLLGAESWSERSVLLERGNPLRNATRMSHRHKKSSCMRRRKGYQGWLRCLRASKNNSQPTATILEVGAAYLARGDLTTPLHDAI